ncbi:hypothetical protein BGZ49_004468 [Haplosporangium sp. Z 27]|nr:hypothetical protein BGZ49_004468 [Haplosporangium sp. Z 27]
MSSQESLATIVIPPILTTTQVSAPIITTATTAEVATTPSSQAPVTTSTPPITTLQTTPAITTTSSNDPPTGTATTTTSIITEPSMTTATTTPYTTHYITTISLVTITTFVPQTTVISGKATTIYSTEITVSSVPTIIPDPSQPPPPLALYHGGGPLPWQIALISVASSILVAACISMIIFVRTRRRRNKDRRDTDLMSVGIESWSDPNKTMMVVGSSSRGGCGEAEAVIPIGNGSNNGGGIAGGGEYWSEYDGATGLVTTDEYGDNHHRYQYHHQHIPREPKMQSSGGAMEFYHNYDEDQYHHYRGYQPHTYTHDNNNVNNSSYNNYESYSNRNSTVQQQQQQEEEKDYYPASYRDDYGASLARQQQQQQYLPVNYPQPPLLPTTNSFLDDMNHGSASPSLTVVSQNMRELYAQLPKDDQKGRYSEISSSVGGGGNIMIRDLDLETSSGEMNAKFELYRKSPQALIAESKGTQEQEEQEQEEQELQEQKDHQQQQQHLERLLETI